MNDEQVRNYVTELLPLATEIQAKVLESLQDADVGRIFTSFPQVNRDIFLASLTSEVQRVRYRVLLQQHGTSREQPRDVSPIQQEGRNEELPVDEPYDFIIYKGRLESYHVQFVREITPLIWVCKVSDD